MTVYLGATLAQVLSIDTDGERIYAIRAIVNPAKLRRAARLSALPAE